MLCCTSGTHPGGPGLEQLLAAVGPDRIVIHKATGMIAAQLDDTIANALARLRAAAFASGRPVYAFSTGRAVQASAADSHARWPAFAPQASSAGF